MTLQEFQQFAAARGYKCARDTAVGAHRDYPFSAKYSAGGTGVIQAEFQLETRPDKRFAKAIKEALPKGCSAAAGQNGAMTLTCKGKNADLSALFPQCLDLVTREFQNTGAAPATKCPLCKQPGCDAYAQVNGYVPVHRTCVESKSGDTLTTLESNRLNGNYLTGFLGALLGALVGVIPTVVAAALTQRIYGILYALIPICAYQGYKLLKGKLNPAALASSIICSIFALFLMEIGGFYLENMSRFGMLSPMDLVEGYFDNVGGMAMIQNLVFLVLGVWIAWSYISRTGVHESRDAHVTVETMLPMSGAAAWPSSPEE